MSEPRDFANEGYDVGDLFPEDSKPMGDRTKGLLPEGKFQVIRRDGTDQPNDKHDGCDYFVLDLTHDAHAVPALRAYAASARADGYALLADDLEKKLADHRAPLVGEEVLTEIDRLLRPPAIAYDIVGYWFDHAKQLAAIARAALSDPTSSVRASALEECARVADRKAEVLRAATRGMSWAEGASYIGNAETAEQIAADIRALGEAQAQQAGGKREPPTTGEDAVDVSDATASPASPPILDLMQVLKDSVARKAMMALLAALESVKELDAISGRAASSRPDYLSHVLTLGLGNVRAMIGAIPYIRNLAVGGGKE